MKNKDRVFLQIFLVILTGHQEVTCFIPTHEKTMKNVKQMPIIQEIWMGLTSALFNMLNVP